MLEASLYILAAYVIGSIPFGYLAGRLNGVDLREHGSHNIGATNAIRVLGKRWGVPVFICDFLKGYAPLLGMKLWLGGDATLFSPGQMGVFLATMFALVLGHTFTCFLRFKGGKGVATTAGCLFALSPTVGGVALGAWVLSMLLTRYVSVSSMVAGLAMIVAAALVFWRRDGRLTESDAMVLVLLFVIFVLVVYKHRSNIARLCKGTEPKAFSSSSPSDTTKKDN